MKKIVALVLMAALFVPYWAFSEKADVPALLEQQKQQGLIHLWDIPFGINVWEFKGMVEQKTGFLFEVDSKRFGKTRGCNMVNAFDGVGAPQVSGHTVERIQAQGHKAGWDVGWDGNADGANHGTKEIGLKEICISWMISPEESKENIIERYFDLLSKLTAKYGNDLVSEFVIGQATGKDEFRDIYCIIEDENGSPRKADVLEALNRPEKKVDLRYAWGNAELEFSYSLKDEELQAISLTFYDQALEPTEHAEPILYADVSLLPKPNNVEF